MEVQVHSNRWTMAVRPEQWGSNWPNAGCSSSSSSGRGSIATAGAGEELYTCQEAQAILHTVHCILYTENCTLHT